MKVVNAKPQSPSGAGLANLRWKTGNAGWLCRSGMRSWKARCQLTRPKFVPPARDVGSCKPNTIEAKRARTLSSG